MNDFDNDFRPVVKSSLHFDFSRTLYILIFNYIRFFDYAQNDG